MLRRQESLVWVAVMVALAALCAAALTGPYHSGIGAGWRNPPMALCLVVYAVGAVGVIFLGLCHHRLARVVTSIARQFRSMQKISLPQTKLRGNDELARALNAHLADREALIKRLQGELSDLRIRARLSERQKQHTEAIIYSLRDAVVVLDDHNRLTMANAPAARLLGFDIESDQHRPISDICGDRHPEFVRFLQQSAQSRIEGTRRELTFSSGQEPHTFDTIVSCVQEAEAVLGVVAVLHDITREKEISQMKNDFISHVSHELKTPLASITAYSEMLVDGEADDEDTCKEFYGIIQSQAQRLNRLIEDILNVSRIESGMIKTSKEPASLTILIEQQMSMIRSYAEEKNITVTGPAPIVCDQVYADRDMISQVIVNLLSNAVKYTPSGGSVTIRAEVDETTDLAQVTVTDTGVGIPEDEIEHVFDKFYRVGANNKQAKGTGLGLNLVKQIVEKIHNGRVFVTSQVGAGSTFGFELPLARVEMAEAT